MIGYVLNVQKSRAHRHRVSRYLESTVPAHETSRDQCPVSSRDVSCPGLMKHRVVQTSNGMHRSFSADQILRTLPFLFAPQGIQSSTYMRVPVVDNRRGKLRDRHHRFHGWNMSTDLPKDQVADAERGKVR
jgi:hypothetical protein